MNNSPMTSDAIAPGTIPGISTGAVGATRVTFPMSEELKPTKTLEGGRNHFLILTIQVFLLVRYFFELIRPGA
jgi:hypothetical protein